MNTVQFKLENNVTLSRLRQKFRPNQETKPVKTQTTYISTIIKSLDTS